jgi:hypothetical protein
LRLSFWRSTQPLTHTVRPAGQLATHFPEEQGWPWLQETPQAPQFSGLEARSTQLPLHDCCPVGQAHLPLKQVVPAAQVTPQPPQFALSLVAWTQAPEQASNPAAQVAAH